MKEKVLVIIGLRSGSKSIKNKNITKFNRKPLFYWILKQAKLSKLVNKIIISTDSIYYKNLCLKYNVDVPFLRPKKLSEDKSTEKEYIFHALKWLRRNENYQPDIVVRLQATSPFQLVEDIDKSIKVLINDKSLNSSMVGYKSSLSPHKALSVNPKTKLISNYINDNKDLEINNRQKFKPAYYRSNIITTRYSYLIKTNKQVGKKSKFIEIPEIRSIDINSKFDLEIAEMIAQKYKFCKD